MGLMKHERESHKLTLEAYDRLLPKMKARKTLLKAAYEFINTLIVYAEARGDAELKILCQAYLVNIRSD